MIPETTKAIQSSLSTLQMMPFIGPLVASPVKALFSTAQLACGLALSVIFSIATAITVGRNSFCYDTTKESLKHVGYGFKGLTSSVLNIITLGASSNLECLGNCACSIISCPIRALQCFG